MVVKAGRPVLGLVLGLALGVPALPASAQQAPAPEAAPAAPAKKRVARRAAPKNASEIVLNNTRGAAVTALSVTSAAGKNVATLKRPLDPGKKLSIRLPKNSGCVFAINAQFSDDAEFDQAEVNLCTDKVVRFVD